MQLGASIGLSNATEGRRKLPKVLCSKTGARCTKKIFNSKLEDENRTF